MNILVTNDDGIQAPGIAALAEALSEIAEVTVVAPHSENSGGSQSITIHNPIRFKKFYNGDLLFGYGVSGTPADSVKLALFDILEKQPDYVVSGVNRGPNNAVNILYSGTVGAAFEGAVNSVPSVAVSLVGFDYKDYGPSAAFARDFILHIDKIGADKNTVYNINVPPAPADEIKGVKWTTMSMNQYLLRYEKRKDPFGEPYYWLSDFRKPETEDPQTDDAAIRSGFISVTPLQVDRTGYAELEKLKKNDEVFKKNIRYFGETGNASRR